MKNVSEPKKKKNSIVTLANKIETKIIIIVALQENIFERNI